MAVKPIEINSGLRRIKITVEEPRKPKNIYHIVPSNGKFSISVSRENFCSYSEYKRIMGNIFKLLGRVAVKK